MIICNLQSKNRERLAGKKIEQLQAGTITKVFVSMVNLSTSFFSPVSSVYLTILYLFPLFVDQSNWIMSSTPMDKGRLLWFTWR